MDAPDIVEALQKRKYQIEDLTWKDVEDVTFFLVTTKLNVLATVASIEKNIVGEIDIVVNLRKEMPFKELEIGNEYDQVFIECKHYKSKIPLTTAAKVFCAGIYHQPRFLVIVRKFASKTINTVQMLSSHPAL